MKKLIFVLAAFFLVSSAFYLNSCSNSTSTTVRDTVFQHPFNFIQTPTTDDLRGVRFTTLKTGVAVGAGSIVHTFDGGLTWIPVVSGSGLDLYAVSFSDINNGMAVGSNGALKTTDGGLSWTAVALAAPFQPRNVQMTSSTTAYIIGNHYNDVDNTQGFIYKTTDGGITWHSLTITAPGLYGICFTDAMNGWVSGWQGVIFKTTDGGTSWVQQISHTTGTQISQLSFADATHGMAAGYPSIAGDPTPPTSGYIITTSDGGATWTPQATLNAMDGIWMSDANNAMAAGWNGTIMETADGGKSWSSRSLGPLRLINIFLNDANNGATVGLNGQIYVIGPH